MPTRLLIAYLLIVLLGAGVFAAIWRNVRNSQLRKVARQRTRQRADRLMADQSKDHDG